MQSFKCVNGEWVQLSKEEVMQSFIAAQEAWEKRCRDLGHNCMDHVEHHYDAESKLGDYYTCGECGALLQVG